MEPADSRRANVLFHQVLASSYHEQPFFRPENQQRVREVLASLALHTGGGRLLDVGCGTGFILNLAHDLFNQLDGIDVTPEMLERVVSRPNVKIQLAPAEALPFEDNEFDVVTAYSVLHHLPDLETVFSEIRRVLRPGGRFYADESPSQHYRSALLGLSNQAGLGEALVIESAKLKADADEFSTRYGIDQEITRRAMVQNYRIGGLTEDNLRFLLRDAGFLDVEIQFRRFCGEDDLVARAGGLAAEQVRRYLESMLPLTRSLFKYFVLIAQ